MGSYRRHLLRCDLPKAGVDTAVVDLGRLGEDLVVFSLFILMYFIQIHINCLNYSLRRMTGRKLSHHCFGASAL